MFHHLFFYSYFAWDNSTHYSVLEIEFAQFAVDSVTFCFFKDYGRKISEAVFFKHCTVQNFKL